MRTAQPGKPQHCAPEWKGLGSGKGLLKMLTDDVTAEEKTQRPGKHFTKMSEMVAVKGVGRMLGFATYVFVLIGTVYRGSILFCS